MLDKKGFGELLLSALFVLRPGNYAIGCFQKQKSIAQVCTMLLGLVLAILVFNKPDNLRLMIYRAYFHKINTLRKI